jgi:beta-glucosidase
LFRWFDAKGITPRFEFGFGMSYTTFAYSDLTTTSNNATRNGSVPPAGSSPVGDIGGPAVLYEEIMTVSFRVQNTGTLSGNEVSQLYLGFPRAHSEPPKVLRGFARTMLERGDSRTVTMSLRQKDVSVWDVVTQQWLLAKGTFVVMVGSSSRAIHLEGTFQL